MTPAEHEFCVTSTSENVFDTAKGALLRALAYVHDVATVPLLAGAPTFAAHTKPDMKFAPVTVMVLPAYADVGEIESAVGSPTTLKLLLVPKLAVSLIM
jgi:hypothetical protein